MSPFHKQVAEMGNKLIQMGAKEFAKQYPEETRILLALPYNDQAAAGLDYLFGQERDELLRYADPESLVAHIEHGMSPWAADKLTENPNITDPRVMAKVAEKQGIVSPIIRLLIQQGNTKLDPSILMAAAKYTVDRGETNPQLFSNPRLPHEAFDLAATSEHEGTVSAAFKSPHFENHPAVAGKVSPDVLARMRGWSNWGHNWTDADYALYSDGNLSAAHPLIQRYMMAYLTKVPSHAKDHFLTSIPLDVKTFKSLHNSFIQLSEPTLAKMWSKLSPETRSSPDVQDYFLWNPTTPTDVIGDIYHHASEELKRDSKEKHLDHGAWTTLRLNMRQATVHPNAPNHLFEQRLFDPNITGPDLNEMLRSKKMTPELAKRLLTDPEHEHRINQDAAYAISSKVGHQLDEASMDAILSKLGDDYKRNTLHLLVQAPGFTPRHVGENLHLIRNGVAQHVLKDEDRFPLSDEQVEKLIGNISADDGYETDHIPRVRKHFEKKWPNLFDLRRVAEFWNHYERDVNATNMATILSRYHGKPVINYVDYRGEVGHSESYADVIPHFDKYEELLHKHLLEQHAKKEDRYLQIEERNGEPHVRVFRGVHGPYAEQLRKLTGYDPETGTVKNVRVRIAKSPISSWSTDPEQARSFADSDVDGLIIEDWVPLRKVVHSGYHKIIPMQKHAYEHERELVLGHPDERHVVHSSQLHFRLPRKYNYSTGDYEAQNIEQHAQPMGDEHHEYLFHKGYARANVVGDEEIRRTMPLRRRKASPYAALKEGLPLWHEQHKAEPPKSSDSLEAGLQKSGIKSFLHGAALAAGVAAGAHLADDDTAPTPPQENVAPIVEQGPPAPSWSGPTPADKLPQPNMTPTYNWSPEGLTPGLRPIAHLESSNGKNLIHAAHSKGDFHTAFGALGLKPVTAHWAYTIDKELQKLYPDMHDKQAFLHRFLRDPQFYNDIASSHWHWLKKQVGGDRAKAAYAWRWGVGAAKRAAADVINSDRYVIKYNQLRDKLGLNKSEPLVKEQELPAWLKAINERVAAAEAARKAGLGIVQRDPSRKLDEKRLREILGGPPQLDHTIYRTDPDEYGDYYTGGDLHLDHYSPKEGLTELDPSFQGTGHAGQERNKGEDRVPRTYFYMRGTKPESIFDNHYRYEATIKSPKLYDLSADPHGLTALRQFSPNSFSRLDPNEIERTLYSMGYDGYIRSGNRDPTMRRVVAIFNKTPVKQVGKGYQPPAPAPGTPPPSMNDTMAKYEAELEQWLAKGWAPDEEADLEALAESLALEYLDA